MKKAPKPYPFDASAANRGASSAQFRSISTQTDTCACLLNFTCSCGENRSNPSLPSFLERSLPQKAAEAWSGTSPAMSISPKSNDSKRVDREETNVPFTSLEQRQMGEASRTTIRPATGPVIDRDDPISPLFSTRSFEELQIQPQLLKGIYNMGFQRPSRIQEVVLPLLSSNAPRNIIAQSQAGTGKTSALSLAILSRIDPQLNGPQAMILAPTFELALVVGSMIEQMARFLPQIKVAYAFRRTDAVRQPSLRRGELLEESIVVGTPGTVEDWCFKKRVIDLSQLRILAVDNADIMIDAGGFQESCANIVQKLNLSQCLIMAFSTFCSDAMMDFARQIIPNPRVFRLKREKQMLDHLRQYFLPCHQPEEKYSAIQQIYACLNIGQTIICCRTRSAVRELNIRMSNEGFSVRESTAALDVEQRASVIKAFHGGLFRVIIATNATLKGLACDDVSLVINYDMPIDTKYNTDYETYIHRSGCCGRFGRPGYVFNLIGSERDLQVMRDIENYFQRRIEEITIEKISTLAADLEE